MKKKKSFVRKKNKIIRLAFAKKTVIWLDGSYFELLQLLIDNNGTHIYQQYRSFLL